MKGKRDRNGRKRRDEYKRLIERERSYRDGTEADIVETAAGELVEAGAFRCGKDDDYEEEKIPLTDDLEDGDFFVKKKRMASPYLVKLICVYLVIFSLVAALLIMGFAFYYSEKDTGENETAPPVIDQSETGGKVVFVKDNGSENGALSPSELYELRVSSVVTVRCDPAGMGSSLGSGFVFSEDGYIATAEHVVSGAEEIWVVLHDGREYAAKLVCGDTLSDIALLKIEAKSLSPVSFGRSSELLVGEPIYTIGTPTSEKYAGTFGSGEVTYVDRVLDIESSFGVLEKRMTVLQTNVDLSKGNSGCPVFDCYGDLVGMVTMRLGEGDGIGFAIPSDGLRKVLIAMKNMEKIDADTVSDIVTLAPRLGITGESVEVGGTFGYKVKGFVDCGSTASVALRVDDVILEINGGAVYRERDITARLEDYSSGDTVSVTVLRSGQRLAFDVVLGS